MPTTDKTATLTTAMLHTKKAQKALAVAVKSLLSVSPEIASAVIAEVKDTELRSVLAARTASPAPAVS